MEGRREQQMVLLPSGKLEETVSLRRWQLHKKRSGGQGRLWINCRADRRVQLVEGSLSTACQAMQREAPVSG